MFTRGQKLARIYGAVNQGYLPLSHMEFIDLTDELEKRFLLQLLEQDKNDILSGQNGSTMAHITK